MKKDNGDFAREMKKELDILIEKAREYDWPMIILSCTYDEKKADTADSLIVATSAPWNWMPHPLSNIYKLLHDTRILHYLVEHQSEITEAAHAEKMDLSLLGDSVSTDELEKFMSSDKEIGENESLFSLIAKTVLLVRSL